VLDTDAAGQQAAALLHDHLAERAVVVDLPLGVKDPADLAVRSDGCEALLTALHAAGYRDAIAARTAIRDHAA
jgi:DNA primase